jgi:glycosyltransferase involved in cell wall biosynthesis
MKILFVIDTLGPGGKERRMTELLKALKTDRRFEFELVLMSHDIHYREVVDMGIVIHYIIRKSKKDLSVFRKLYRVCKNYRPEIVHCWESMTAVFSAPVCKILKIKMVNGMVIDTPVRRNIFNKNWLRARLTFPLSTVVAGNSMTGLQAYRAPEKRSICIHNGINMSRFTQLRDPSLVKKEILGEVGGENFIAGMVAAFDERKDYPTLIKAAIALCRKYSNLRFILVGEGEKFDCIKSEIPDPLFRRIVFTGKRTDVESIVNTFNLGILLTDTRVHGEGISNSIIEYMALAKPVIATIGGGTGEAVADNETGFLVAPLDADEVAGKVEILFNDPILCQRMGSAGQKRIEAEFSINHMVRQYADLYLNLVS